MKPAHRSSEEPARDALSRVRREGRWWWVHARQARRIWRWAAVGGLALFMLLVLLRQPLGDWVMKSPRTTQLLAQGDQALAAGRLSAADGSGARELFTTALALDGDRPEGREGLARTGLAALARARAQTLAGELEAAEASLALARELQVPQPEAAAVARLLRDRRAAAVGHEALLRQAGQALVAGRLADGEAAALPLFARVLTLWPDNLEALEGREDALTDLLQQSRNAAAEGELEVAARQLAQARGFDAGHADLPASEAALATALDERLARAARERRRGQWERAAASLQSVLAVVPEDARALEARDTLGSALLARSQRLGGDFELAAAQRDIELARALGMATPAVVLAEQQRQRARAARDALAASAGERAGSPRATRALQPLLAKMQEAEREGRFISPPGDNAFDALRAAQAVAPRDPRVRRAAARLLPATRQCFADGLRQNRVEAAGNCLQAWQTLAPGDAALEPARRRLAQRWLAIGSERLGRGDVAFASRAAEQAGFWFPALGELPPFEQRLQAARLSIAP